MLLLRGAFEPGIPLAAGFNTANRGWNPLLQRVGRRVGVRLAQRYPRAAFAGHALL